MFPSKLKVAAGLAVGALTLGAASSSAVANTNKAVTAGPTTFTLGSGSHQLKLIGFNGITSLKLPAGGFKRTGECVSFFAKTRNVALAPQGTTTGSATLPKHYHGKLVRAARIWCETQLNTTASHHHHHSHGHAPADSKHANS